MRSQQNLSKNQIAFFKFGLYAGMLGSIGYSFLLTRTADSIGEQVESRFSMIRAFPFVKFAFANCREIKAQLLHLAHQLDSSYSLF